MIQNKESMEKNLCRMILLRNFVMIILQKKK